MKAFDEEKRSTVQYLPQIKQIHHGQPPFEHLRPAAATRFSSGRQGVLQRKWTARAHAQRTDAGKVLTLPPRLPVTYLGVQVGVALPDISCRRLRACTVGKEAQF